MTLKPRRSPCDRFTINIVCNLPLQDNKCRLKAKPSEKNPLTITTKMRKIITFFDENLSSFLFFATRFYYSILKKGRKSRHRFFVFSLPLFRHFRVKVEAFCVNSFALTIYPVYVIVIEKANFPTQFWKNATKKPSHNDATIKTRLGHYAVALNM